MNSTADCTVSCVLHVRLYNEVSLTIDPLLKQITVYGIDQLVLAEKKNFL